NSRNGFSVERSPFTFHDTIFIEGWYQRFWKITNIIGQAIFVLYNIYILDYNNLLTSLSTAMATRVSQRAVVSENGATAKTYTTLLSDFKKNPFKYLDLAGVLFVVISADKKVVYMNKFGCNLLGYAKEEVLGVDWFQTFIPKRIRYEVERVFEDLVKGKPISPEFFENPVLKKDNSELIISWHNSVLKDNSGHILGTISAGSDMSGYKRVMDALRRNEERYKKLFEQAPYGYHSLDAEGHLIDVNESWLKMMGYEKQEVVGENITSFLDPAVIDSFKKAFEDYKKSGVAKNLPIRFITKNGESLDVMTLGRASFDENGDFIQTHCMLREID
ncbi:MAG: PAS domain-containing protein, partial [Candidatus Dojkabacteria bacterium]|nr:PAS domain-containing protein [Candidatus Dojkabacteria bacterium]